MSGGLEPARIFVRHADPEIDPSRPAPEWGLSDAGRRRASALAPIVRAWTPVAFWSSPEPKARETAEALTGDPGAIEIVEGLREHERYGVPWFPDPASFVEAVTALFRAPGERVFGEESADEAERRFAEAVEESAGRAPGAPSVFVTHGTVMALHLGRLLGRDPLELWTAMRFGAVAALSWPEPRLVEWWPGG